MGILVWLDFVVSVVVEWNSLIVIMCLWFFCNHVHIRVCVSVCLSNCSSQHCGHQWLMHFYGKIASVTQQENLFCCHSQSSALNISRWIKWLNTHIFLPASVLSRLSQLICSTYILIMFALHIIYCMLSNLIDLCWERLLKKIRASRKCRDPQLRQKHNITNQHYRESS